MPIDPRNPPAISQAIAQNENKIVLAPKRVYVMTTAMLEQRETEFDNGDDVTQDYKKVMVKHTADSTANAQNTFPVADQPMVDLSLRNPDGTPAALTAPGVVSTSPQNDFSKGFEDPAVRGAYTILEQSSTPYLKIGNGTGKIPLRKGKTSNDDLLPVENLYSELGSEESVMGQVIDQTYQENNNWSEKKRYSPPDGNVEEEQSNVGRLIIQKARGVHVPRKLGADTESESQETTAVDINVLKQMGYQMLFGASGEYYEPGPVSEVGDLGQDALDKVSSLAPGLARLGFKVPTTRFSPTELMSKMAPEFSKPNLTNGIKSDTVFSFGNQNNPLAPFDSLDSRFALPAAALLATSLAGILQGVATVLEADAFSDSLFSEILGSGPSTSRRRGLGISAPTSLIIQTMHDYPEAVRKGFEIIVGSGDVNTSNPLAAISGELRSFNQSPGYYSMILRNVLRGISTDILNNAINSIAGPVGALVEQTGNGNGSIKNQMGAIGTPGGLDINPQIGLSADVSNVAASIQKIFSSRTVRFMNICAQIGDRYLTAESDSEKFFTGDELGLTPRQIEEDSGVLLAALTKISRFGDATRAGGVKTSTPFGTSTTPSMYILPEGIIRGKTRFGSADRTGEGRGDFKRVTGRISKEDVIAIEKQLESSYVPFYFHDLRTNEIISFHAFLNSLTDNYEAEYVSSDGYGRSGTIPIYKNTNRAISFDFMVVATNEDDFNEMWWKINKLVTMTYTQYSEGRVLSVDGKRFTQPFSQIPTASPVIRLRIGDVIKSNFDRFNLARLFGISKTDSNVFNLDDNSDISRRNEEESDEERIRNRRAALSDFTNLNVGDLIWVTIPEVPATGRVFPVRDATSSRTTPDRDERRDLESLEGTHRIRIDSTLPALATDDSVTTYQASLVDPIPSDLAITSIKIRITTSDPNGRNAIIPHAPSGLEESSTDDSAASAGGSSDTSSETEGESGIDLQEFFSPANNAIVKAFDSTRGRGLAGVIKSLNFTWIEDQITWNTGKFNERAPKVAKIQVSFTPIHDLAPGLDSDGFNSAPIYGVGELSTGTKKVAVGSEGTDSSSASEQAFEQQFNTAATRARIRIRRPEGE